MRSSIFIALALSAAPSSSFAQENEDQWAKQCGGGPIPSTLVMKEKLQRKPMEDGVLYERSGPGLWIGGTRFLPDDIAETGLVHPDDMNPDYAINVRFTPSGVTKFRCVQIGRVGQPVEMSYNRRLLVRPHLNEPVMGDSVQISGAWDAKAAMELKSRIATIKQKD